MFWVTRPPYDEGQLWSCLFCKLNLTSRVVLFFFFSSAERRFCKNPVSCFALMFTFIFCHLLPLLLIKLTSSMSRFCKETDVSHRGCRLMVFYSLIWSGVVRLVIPWLITESGLICHRFPNVSSVLPSEILKLSQLICLLTTRNFL